MGHNVVKILDSRIGFTNIVKVSIQHLITSDINFYRKYKIRIWYSTSVGVKFWCNKDCFIWVDIIFTKETIPILNSQLSIPKLRISFSPSLLNIFWKPWPSLSNLWYCNSQICPTQNIYYKSLHKQNVDM